MPTDPSYRSALEQALACSLSYLDHLADTPVAATATLGDLRARLSRTLADDGMAARDVIDELVADVEGGIVGSAGGRFFAWVVGGALPAALAADWLTSAWDQNAGLYAAGPAEAVVEEVAGRWLKDLLGLPATASFALVTGCQMAHVTCLAAARNALLTKRGWDVERKGLAGAPSIRIVTSDQRHGTVERAVRFLGLGSDSIVDLPTDDRGCLPVRALGETLGAIARQPTIVHLQAGDLNIGAFDDFAELIPVAHESGAWVHVDGAFGLWAAASPSHRSRLRGVKHADSWATDGHKWLNVPYDCGYAFVAEPAAHRSAMSYHASYLIHDTDARDQLDWNPEWSRRGRGFATYAAIRQLGRRGLADLVDRTCRHAHSLVTRIGSLPSAQVMWEPTINQGLLRFLDVRSGATEADHDRRTEAVIAAIVRTGEAFFGGTTWRGRRCMRVSVSNWQTGEADIERAFAAVRSVLGTATYA